MTMVATLGMVDATIDSSVLVLPLLSPLLARAFLLLNLTAKP
jgi:hypothetical protein